MATTATTQLPPGIYRIIAATVREGDLEPDRLTDIGEGRVTLRPHSIIDEPKQEWRIDHGEDGNSIIGRPTDKWPSPFLTYEGALEEGSLIQLHTFDFPKNEWHFELAPGFKSLIRVAGSELGIKIFPLVNPIFPPPPVRLVLGSKDQVEWVFEFVREK